MTRALVQDTDSLGILGPPHPLGNLTGLSLGELLSAAIRRSENLIEPALRGPTMGSTRPAPREPIFTLLLQTLDGSRSVDRFPWRETLLSPAKQTCAELNAYFIHEKFLRPELSEVNGTVVLNKKSPAYRRRFALDHGGGAFSSRLHYIVCNV